MNFDISFIPERTSGERSYGLTMMMDKGLSLKESEHFIASSAPFTDLVKFGFGTALITRDLKEKVRLYETAGLKPYFGGTLFEMFFVRGQFDDYRRFVKESGLNTVEVSDGTIKMEHDEKLECIEILTKDFRVLSEVGTKVKGVELSNEVWVSNMKSELEAGAWKVIGEARESGTIGLYQSDGSANVDLINDIMKEISVNDVLWEAPNKAQQTMFIKLLGANVNLGNIAPGEVVSLEALRCGMRGDTFFDGLPDEFQSRKL
ncbi:MAG: phosphosulfolactate synthase [Bacteroidales bacterium]|nr:phosphosulfolactate synthase [Bacteroidales bacterium]